MIARLFFAPQGRGIVAALLVSLVGAGFSAHAGLTRGNVIMPTEAPRVAIGYEADDHFPGAAMLYADEPAPAPPQTDPLAAMPGVTGTIALPDVAVPDVTDASVRPAQPFVLRGTSQDKLRALQCLTTAIYYEAASEPDDGQAAVAQVILNRVRHPTFPATVCGVIYQGSEKAGCQFSYACDGAMARVPMRAAWERARRAAARALAGYVFAPVGLATHYHTYAVRPAWNRTLVMTDVVGAHFFHRWKGWWGTPAAFRQDYVGNEPLPGPHRPTEALIAPTLQAPAIAAATQALLQQAASAAVQPVAPVANVQPEHAESGAVLPQFARTTAADSQILDKWRDTGKPLR